MSIFSKEPLFQQFEDFDDEQVVTFVYEDGCDVVHFNETHVDTALEETDTIQRLAEVLESGVTIEGDPLDSLREQGFLDNYERAEDRSFSEFKDYLAETIKENFYDMYELVEENTEHFDHKRGFTNLKTELRAKVGSLRNIRPGMFGLRPQNPFNYWEAKVDTPKGTLSFTVKD
jgi:hypothetical protein